MNVPASGWTLVLDPEAGTTPLDSPVRLRGVTARRFPDRDLLQPGMRIVVVSAARSEGDPALLTPTDLTEIWYDADEPR